MGNNPIGYSDPTGHIRVEGCTELAGGCDITQQTIDDDLKKAEEFRQTTNANKCKKGNKLHCSYAENNPVETAAFVGGGLVLAGMGAAATGYMSAAELATALNAGISVGADCISVAVAGRECTAGRALITASASLASGWLGGAVAQRLGIAGIESIERMQTLKPLFTYFGAKAAIQLGMNTFQRAAKGDGMQTNQMSSDFGSGLVQAGIGLLPGDPNALSHIGEAVGALFEWAGSSSPDPSMELFP